MSCVTCDLTCSIPVLDLSYFSAASPPLWLQDTISSTPATMADCLLAGTTDIYNIYIRELWSTSYEKETSWHMCRVAHHARLCFTSCARLLQFNLPPCFLHSTFCCSIARVLAGQVQQACAFAPGASRAALNTPSFWTSRIQWARSDCLAGQQAPNFAISLWNMQRNGPFPKYKLRQTHFILFMTRHQVISVS